MATDRTSRRAVARIARLIGAFAVLAAAIAVGPGVARADDPVFRIEFRDGTTTPSRIVVPADTRFELELVNAGSTPAEFESLPLRKEKVIAPGVTTILVLKGLEKGEYPFFDDFHPDAPPAVVVAE